MTDASTTAGIIQNWQEKAEMETDVFNEFICYWISFNCYYSKVTKENVDSKAFIELYKIQKISDIYKTLLINDEFKAALIELQRHVPIKDMRMGHTDKEKDLKDFELRSVIEVLYQARCNLFHGDKSGDSARDKIIIKACIPVLKSLVREFNYNNPPEM